MRCENHRNRDQVSVPSDREDTQSPESTRTASELGNQGARKPGNDGVVVSRDGRRNDNANAGHDGMVTPSAGSVGAR